MNSNMSGSMQIKEFLLQNTNNGIFTSRDIMDNIPDISNGSVTGFLAKLKNNGFIKVVGRDGGNQVYEIVGNIEDVHVRNVRSAGGAEGRTIGAGVSRKQRLITSLLSLASEIEKMRGDLSDFTTHEIIKELEKRTQK